jgi:hypothetical protein
MISASASAASSISVYFYEAAAPGPSGGTPDVRNIGREAQGRRRDGSDTDAGRRMKDRLH